MRTPPGEELDCAIYVDAPDGAALLAAVADVTAGHAPVPGTTVLAPGAELDVRANDEADPARAAVRPDGFLHFAHRVEVYPAEPPAPELARRLLERFWGAGWPAVAACDYEDELPHAGGRAARDLPWPGG